MLAGHGVGVGVFVLRPRGHRDPVRDVYRAGQHRSRDSTRLVLLVTVELHVDQASGPLTTPVGGFFFAPCGLYPGIVQ
jgi:hypothetical protein